MAKHQKCLYFDWDLNSRFVLQVLNEKIRELNQGDSGIGGGSMNNIGIGSSPKLGGVVASSIGIGGIGGLKTVKRPIITTPGARLPSANTKHIKNLYAAIRDFRDTDGRQLSEVFLKLPSKTLYPDYYEVSFPFRLKDESIDE